MLMVRRIHFSTVKIFIRNNTLPACINCTHFIEDKTNYPYDSAPNDKYGKCKKYGEMSIITGEVEYDYARVCRKDETKCGRGGNGFVAK